MDKAKAGGTIDDIVDNVYNHPINKKETYLKNVSEKLELRFPR